MGTERNRFSDQLRHAIKTGGLSRYRIWMETGIDQPTLSRFMRGTCGLSIESIDKLAELLQLTLTKTLKPSKRKGR
jgi:transcriptional regulator with XRE-family HTH domain